MTDADPDIGALVETPSGERSQIHSYTEPAPGIIEVTLENGHEARHSNITKIQSSKNPQ